MTLAGERLFFFVLDPADRVVGKGFRQGGDMGFIPGKQVVAQKQRIVRRSAGLDLEGEELHHQGA